MILPDRSVDQLALDKLRIALWYGVVYEEERKGRVNFFVRAGGFAEARELIIMSYSGEDYLLKAATFYIPSEELSNALNVMFGDLRRAVRVASVEVALTDPLFVQRI